MEQKLTKTYIESLPLQTDGKRLTIMDTVTPGFGMRVGSQTKTFIAIKRMPQGAPKRVTIGKYGQLTLDQARRNAQDVLAKLSHGVDINAEKAAARAVVKVAESMDNQTLGWLFDEYEDIKLKDAKGKISEGTQSSMNDCRKMFGARSCQTLKLDKSGDSWSAHKMVELPSWLQRPLRSITADEVLERFNVLEVTRPQKLIGGILAPMVRTHQIGFKFAQGAFEFFIPRNYEESRKSSPEKKGEMLENPFKILKVFNKWTPVGKKTRIVDFQDPDEFGGWWNALQTYRSVSEVPADYIEFSLLQGARSIEVIYMKWDMVDFQKKIVNYSKTKNKEDYKVPLSARALEILKRRLEKNPKGVEWVWHYPDSKTGHIPKDTKHHFHKLEEYGAKYVTTHDLKRTYASAANTLREYKESEINYLLKHKHEGVNEHYFVRNEPLLREIIQKVEDKFLAIVEEYEEKKAA